MTAEPTSHVPWSPDPIMQRHARYTIEDVLSLPSDAPRVELNDGVMVVVPSPTYGHQTINVLLTYWLRQNAPGGLAAAMAVGVGLGLKNTVEPDAVLLREPVSENSHYFASDEVVLAVEIVSPGTRRRDRLEKPPAYAAAGVPHYWRIEQDPLHVLAYDLVNGEYRLVADSTEELVLTRPFEIRLPIRDITP